MKSKLFSVLVLLVLSLAMVSCMESDPVEEYTAEKEQELLAAYLSDLTTAGYLVNQTPLGVHYVMMTEGEGPFPEAGDTISVQYVGYLMDGSIFDTSFKASYDSTWTYIHKEVETPAGWEDMMSYMNKGSKMEFVIPSSLGYGSTWQGGIPPYSSLVFVAIMKDVRKL